MRIDSPISCNAQITGSFTGSFKGDGTLLTGVTAEWDGSHNGDATITGSLTVSSNIIVDGTVDGVDVAGLNTSYLTTSASAASNAAAIAALDDTYATDADITSLSSSAHTQRLAIESGLDSDISSLSSSAHTQRLAIESGLDSDISSLSGSSHSQRVALDGAQTTALNSLSSSAATALRAEYVAADLTLSGSAHTQREAIKSLATSANNSLSSSIAASLRAEYVAADSALSSSQKTYIDAKVAGLVDSAPGTLDTLNELAAALGDDPNFATTTATSIGEKLAKASNLSDLADAATARTNLGVDTKANTWTGVSGDVTITSLGVATVADDSHNHIISNIDGLQTALDAKQAAGTYNTVIGTDTDLDTTGAEVVDTINVTDGVITSMSKRTITLGNLGYTGATDADNYSSWTIRDGDTTTYTITSGDTLQIASGTGITSNFTADDVLTITNTAPDQTVSLTAGSNVTITGTYPNFTIASSYTDTNTTYSAGTGLSLVGTTFNNTITNNNQLTNGAGYTTYSANQALDNSSNVHFEGLMVGQTTGATANTIRCVGDVVAYYSSDAQFKDNVTQLEGALDKVKQIRGVSFDWNDKQEVYEGHDIGVIAQEVEAVYPELVHYRAHDDSKAVDYVKLTAVLIEAVKELSAKVEKLENK